MKKYHINFAHGRYLKSQEYCSDSAKYFGFDNIFSYKVNDIDKDFISKNINIFNQSRGFAYWIWKPYFLLKTLNLMKNDEILVYSDSGSYYQSSVEPLIDKLKNDPMGILSFELNGLIEKDYTKRDTFNIMNLDKPEYTDTSQREATYIWLVKNDFTLSIVNEYLNYAQNENIITDIPNITGENYTSFKDHRHDQSIWSLLCKKYDIEPHRLISQHGLHLLDKYPNDSYGQITFHHRNPM